MILGITINRMGCTRWVILTKNYAIKFPALCHWNHFLQGILGNIQEQIFWKNLKHPKLCPILFYLPSGLFLVMKRGEDLTMEEFFGINYEEWISEDGWIIPVENKICSFKKIDGNIVAVDYGS